MLRKPTRRELAHRAATALAAETAERTEFSTTRKRAHDERGVEPFDLVARRVASECRGRPRRARAVEFRMHRRAIAVPDEQHDTTERHRS
eukprot:scaffold65206_cov31-Tisochrysis_lutea.AAC.3